MIGRSGDTVSELLDRYCQVTDELRRRGVIRSANNPVGDYGELLFCRAFNWEPQPNSRAGFDAIDTSGTRYQIKTRRVADENHSRQLSAIRGIERQRFHFLAAALLDPNFRVRRAALIPVDVVRSLSRPDRHVNALRFLLTDDVWLNLAVKDVTRALKKAEEMVLALRGSL